MFKDQIVTIKASIPTIQVNDGIRFAKLTYRLNDVLQSSVDPETISTSEVIFKFGPFDSGDVIRYQIELDFELTYSSSYKSEFYTFTILEGNAPLSVKWHYAVIGIAAVFGLALITWIGVKKGYFSSVMG